jgi:hypothetical protein
MVGEGHMRCYHLAIDYSRHARLSSVRIYVPRGAPVHCRLFFMPAAAPRDAEAGRD